MNKKRREVATGRDPFALARGGAVVRGIVDLLLVAADEATVIERLEGPPSAEHRSQMETRLEAVEASAPGRVVTGYFLVKGRQLSRFQTCDERPFNSWKHLRAPFLRQPTCPTGMEFPAINVLSIPRVALVEFNEGSTQGGSTPLRALASICSESALVPALSRHFRGDLGPAVLC